MLDVFLDDTKTHRGPPIFGVGGFLFDKPGLKKFEAAWSPRIADLSKPFRTADCNGGWGPFTQWSILERELLLKDLARLIAETRDAGVVATVSLDEYQSYVSTSPDVARVAGTPYTLCLMACIESVGNYLKEHYPEESIYFWIEAGTDNEPEAQDFLRRIYADERLRARFRVGGRSFIPKREAPALCAADFLCWEWQRNYIEAHRANEEGNEDSKWRENFGLLFKDEKSKPIFRNDMNEGRIGVRAIINQFYRVYRD